MNVVLLILQVLVVGALGLALLFPEKFLGKYLEKKAENLATKEDVEEITRKIESVKAQIGREQAALDAKYKLRHEACLEALALIDAYYSQILLASEGQRIAREARTTSEARRCHSKLILACENPAIIDKFLEIFFKNRTDKGFTRPPTDLLNEFRNLVRKELGFGDPVTLDRDVAWFGAFVGDTDGPSPPPPNSTLQRTPPSGAAEL